MVKYLVLTAIALTLVLGLGGCATQPTGSLQYIPGQGWVPAK